jgi:poly-gamma-glutamate capsule biosynthesis protein CapA/YwtB (metallophosphatase superfamily)
MTRGAGVTVFLGGDVMTGRGVDQILPHPNAPQLHEPYVRDARGYVELAERASGAIARPVDVRYIWGDALQELDRVGPQARIVNLETSVTSRDAHWAGKDVHYRMHPRNVGCLTAARIDVCALANNHVLDFGYAGLDDTRRTLGAAGIQSTGAGADLEQARQPAVVDVDDGRRVMVFACGTASSGIPAEWAATPTRAGLNWLDGFDDRSAPDAADAAADDILNRVRRVKRPGDVVIVSIHWGSNWGYDVPPSHVQFAARLLHGDVDIVYGHSSHHPRPVQIINGKLALYGCGECINDYEGISSSSSSSSSGTGASAGASSGDEWFRGELVLLYFPTIDPRTGALVTLRMTPMRIRRMQLVRASEPETRWLQDRLTQISQPFGSRIDLDRGPDGRLTLTLRA